MTGWDHVETIDSLMRKAGHRGQITLDIRKTIRLVRYRSEKLSVAFSEYAQLRRIKVWSPDAAQEQQGRREGRSDEIWLDYTRHTCYTAMSQVEYFRKPYNANNYRGMTDYRREYAFALLCLPFVVFLFVFCHNWWVALIFTAAASVFNDISAVLPPFFFSWNLTGLCILRSVVYNLVGFWRFFGVVWTSCFSFSRPDIWFFLPVDIVLWWWWLMGLVVVLDLPWRFSFPAFLEFFFLLIYLWCVE